MKEGILSHPIEHPGHNGAVIDGGQSGNSRTVVGEAGGVNIGEEKQGREGERGGTFLEVPGVWSMFV